MNRLSPAPVSVVIPCYRCADKIERAIKSVFYQTWRPVEVILVDDCSPDDTLAVISALQNQYPKRWIQVVTLPKNGGPGTARNVGWAQAKQPYIAFLDADDTWHPQKIEIQLDWMLAHPEVALTGHACQVIQKGEYAFEKVSRKIVFRRILPIYLFLSNPFPTPSVILKRDLPQRFVPGKRHGEDYLLWCEICADNQYCYRTDAVLGFLYKYPYGESGLSGDLWRMEKGEIDIFYRLKKNRKIGFTMLNLLWLWSLIKYFKRRFLLLFVRKSK